MKATPLLGWYRALAVATGCALLVFCGFMVAKYGFGSAEELTTYVAMLHGYLYIGYFVVTFMLGQKLKWPLGRIGLHAGRGLHPVRVLRGRAPGGARGRRAVPGRGRAADHAASDRTAGPVRIEGAPPPAGEGRFCMPAACPCGASVRVREPLRGGEPRPVRVPPGAPGVVPSTITRTS